MLKHPLSLLAVLLTAPLLQAQSHVAVNGMGQAVISPPVMFHPDVDAWGGTVFLTLDGVEGLLGCFSGQDGVDSWHSPNNAMGQGKGGSYTFGFNRQPDGTFLDTFTTYVNTATFPCPPGQIGFGSYQGTHKIVSGTGRFQNASGTLQIHGTYVYMPAAGGSVPNGYWNPDISGVLINVAPAP